MAADGGFYLLDDRHDEPVTITWRAADGHVKAKLDRSSGHSGVIFPKPAFWKTHHIEAGDTLKARSNPYTHIFKVPALSVHFDRVHDIVSGVGPEEQHRRPACPGLRADAS